MPRRREQPLTACPAADSGPCGAIASAVHLSLLPRLGAGFIQPARLTSLYALRWRPMEIRGNSHSVSSSPVAVNAAPIR